jgi:hypothetical protein
VVYLANSLDEIEKIAKLGIDAFKLKESVWENQKSRQLKKRYF